VPTGRDQAQGGKSVTGRGHGNKRQSEELSQSVPPNSPSYSSGSLLFLTTGPTNLQPLRLLGLEVEDQILIFQLFTNYYEMEVRQFSPSTLILDKERA